MKREHHQPDEAVQQGNDQVDDANDAVREKFLLFFILFLIIVFKTMFPYNWWSDV